MYFILIQHTFKQYLQVDHAKHDIDIEMVYTFKTKILSCACFCYNVFANEYIVFIF